jgi:hypothetical protein
VKHNIFATAVALVLVQPALAEDNRIYLLQVAPTPGLSNTIYVDQRRDSGALLHGLPGALMPDGINMAGTPAVQFGGNNSAEILMRGTRSEVQLSQQGLSQNGVPTPGFGNSAEILLRGTDQLAILDQMGNGNFANITLRPGDRTIGELHQNGDFNSGELVVRGNDTTAVLIQNGNNIDSALNVRALGANVVYRLNGNNISAPGGVVVVTNIGQSAPITITQTQ